MSILQLWLESCWRQARNIKDWDLELELELTQVPNSKARLSLHHIIVPPIPPALCDTKRMPVGYLP